LVVFCIGVPLAALILVWKFRSYESPHVQMVVRFFYDGYKHKHFYWEIVVMLRKFLLVVVLVVGNTLTYQLYGFVWILQAGKYFISSDVAKTCQLC